MKKIVMASALVGILILTGCSSDGDDNLGVLDEDKPRITLAPNPETGSTDIEISINDTQIPEYGYDAEDKVDGNITNLVVIDSSTVVFGAKGTYTITYSVEDYDGFKDSATRTVTIVENLGNSEQQGLLGGDDYDGTYIDTADLGEQIGSDGYISGSDTVTYDLDTFISWYSDICGGTFNSTLYNETTSSYRGKIDCSNRGLDSIDLTSLSIFTSIDTIRLNNNNLTDIDFTPIQDIQGLNYLYINNNTAELKSQYDTVSERNALFRFFTNLHGGDGKTGLFIGFKPQQNSDEETKIYF